MSLGGAGVFENSFVIKNTKGRINRLILEPWADEVEIQAGDEIVVTGKGPLNEKPIEMELLEEALVIYGWSKSTLSVCVNGVLMKTASALIPCL
jgi:hypothetical protein